MKKKITAAGFFLLIAVWILLTLFAWFGPRQDLSAAERRPLAQMPKLSATALFSGKYAQDFEDFSLDQFPLRDSFRQIKSLVSRFVFGQKDNNNIYVADGHAAALETTLNQSSLTYAVQKFQYLYDTYLQESPVVMAVVPDKGYYLAGDNGYPSMDYAQMFERLEQAMPWAEFVDLTQSLSLEDYYRTDTHWRQENLLNAAQVLAQALGVSVPEFTPVTLETPFWGVYKGQAALPMKADTITVLKNDVLSSCRVYNHETGSYSDVYDLTKLDNLDLYDVYLSGAQALLTIENPQGDPDRELIVFRDSFGSSMVPLLAADYSKVTLVDIRYIRSDMLGEYLDFHGQDVLMLYSTLILNSSMSLK